MTSIIIFIKYLIKILANLYFLRLVINFTIYFFIIKVLVVFKFIKY